MTWDLHGVIPTSLDETSTILLALYVWTSGLQTSRCETTRNWIVTQYTQYLAAINVGRPQRFALMLAEQYLEKTRTNSTKPPSDGGYHTKFLSLYRSSFCELYK